MKKILGHSEAADIIAGGHAGSLRPDGTIEAELQVVTGSTSEVGFTKLTSKGY
jgi:glycine reductase